MTITKNQIFLLLAGLAALLVPASVLVIGFYPPTEAQLGIVQKIFYFHVPSAFLMYAGFGIAFLGSLLYLFNKDPKWDERAAVTVVLASRGYPAGSSSGDVIHGLESADAEVTHAGTALRDDEIVTAGGRVLNVTALGDGREAARQAAYAAADLITFDGKTYRRDIAA